MTYQSIRTIAKEALAEADAQTNNVGLPTYSHLVQTLRYLLSQAVLTDLPASNFAVAQAREALASVDSLAARQAEAALDDFNYVGSRHHY